jgi:hypothetical protein
MTAQPKLPSSSDRVFQSYRAMRASADSTAEVGEMIVKGTFMPRPPN